MRHTAMLVAAACLTTACTTPSTPHEGRTWQPAVPSAAVRQLTAVEPAASSADGGRASSRPPDPQPTGARPSGATPDGSVIERRAAHEIIRRLETEGLEVFDLTTDLVDTAARHATVEVTVLHGSGQSHPHHSRYRIRLHRSPDTWQVTGVQAAG